MEDLNRTPIFIPFRDRISYLREFLNWGLNHNVPPESVYIVDNESSYEEAIAQLKDWEQDGFNILWKDNIGSWGPFREHVIEKCIGSNTRFIVNDPDVVPDVLCRPDIIPFLHELMDKHAGFNKIGLGLRIDDIPDKFPEKTGVQVWEERFWKNRIDDDLYHGSIATTFCLYRKFTPEPWKWQAARTAPPNLARHLPWYVGPDELTSDEVYYYQHASRRQHREPGYGWSPLHVEEK